MKEPFVLVVKLGELTAADRDELREQGIIVLAVNDPSSVRLLRPAAELDAGDMLACAAKAIAGATTDSAATQFGHALCSLIQRRWAEKAKRDAAGGVA